MREASHNFLEILINLKCQFSCGEYNQVIAGGSEWLWANDVGEHDADVAESFTCSWFWLCDCWAISREVGLDGVILDGSGLGKTQWGIAATEIAVQSCLFESQRLVQLYILIHVNFSYNYAPKYNHKHYNIPIVFIKLSNLCLQY